MSFLPVFLQLEEDTLRFGYNDISRFHLSELLQSLLLSQPEVLKKSQYVRKFIHDYTGPYDATFLQAVCQFEQVVQMFKNFYFTSLFGLLGSWFDDIPYYCYYVYVMVLGCLQESDETLESLYADKQYLKTCFVAVICERDWKNSVCSELRRKYSGNWCEVWKDPEFDLNAFCVKVTSHLWFVHEHVVMETDLRRRDVEMRALQSTCVYWCKKSEELKRDLCKSLESTKRLKVQVRDYVKKKNMLLLDMSLSKFSGLFRKRLQA